MQSLHWVVFQDGFFTDIYSKKKKKKEEEEGITF